MRKVVVLGIEAGLTTKSEDEYAVTTVCLVGDMAVMIVLGLLLA